MLGLVDYADSDEEQPPVDTGTASKPALDCHGGETGAASLPRSDVGLKPSTGAGTAGSCQPAAPSLPSAAALFASASGGAREPETGTAQPVTSGKRSYSGSRPLFPNPLAPQPKVRRGSGGASVAASRPESGVLLPPQLRGRPNVATEDLSAFFTRDTHNRLQQRSRD